MEEYDVNHNGFLEWEEYVRFFDNTFPRPTNLEIYVMRTREEGRKWADRFDRLMYPVTDKQVETAVCSRVKVEKSVVCPWRRRRPSASLCVICRQDWIPVDRNGFLSPALDACPFLSTEMYCCRQECQSCRRSPSHKQHLGLPGGAAGAMNTK